MAGLIRFISPPVTVPYSIRQPRLGLGCELGACRSGRPRPNRSGRQRISRLALAIRTRQGAGSQALETMAAAARSITPTVRAFRDRGRLKAVLRPFLSAR